MLLFDFPVYSFSEPVPEISQPVLQHFQISPLIQAFLNTLRHLDLVRDHSVHAAVQKSAHGGFFIDRPYDRFLSGQMDLIYKQIGCSLFLHDQQITVQP